MSIICAIFLSNALIAHRVEPCDSTSCVMHVVTGHSTENASRMRRHEMITGRAPHLICAAKSRLDQCQYFIILCDMTEACMIPYSLMCLSNVRVDDMRRERRDMLHWCSCGQSVSHPCRVSRLRQAMNTTALVNPTIYILLASYTLYLGRSENTNVHLGRRPL